MKRVVLPSFKVYSSWPLSKSLSSSDGEEVRGKVGGGSRMHVAKLICTHARAHTHTKYTHTHTRERGRERERHTYTHTHTHTHTYITD